MESEASSTTPQPTSPSGHASAPKRQRFTSVVRNRFKHGRTTSRGSVMSTASFDDGEHFNPSTASESLPYDVSRDAESKTNDGERPSASSTKQIPESRNNPTSQVRLILGFFVATNGAALLLSQLHWAAGWLAIFVGGHALWKLLLRRTADEEFAAKQQVAQAQWNDAGNTETVQWMNSILASVWPLINNEVFVPFVDLLEDALQLQVPGIVHAVRVEDLDQGVVPLTVNSLKVLPPGEEHFLGQEGVTKQRQAEQRENRSDSEVPNAGADASVDADQQHIDLGEHVNLEISFSYRAPAHAQKGATATSSNAEHGQSVGAAHQSQEPSSASWSSYFRSGSQNAAPAETIHMLLYLAIGLQKIAAIEVPVWVEMIGIEGKMRLRVQLIPSTPFVKHVGFTLLGQPKLELKAKPLGRRMAIDAMNLPLLSSYVLKSIQTTVAPFVAPGSYTMDLGGILGAGDGPTNTYALGVICVVLHSASDLPAADTNGHADPFVSISFARAGKPLFRTRVLVKTKNPVWQEVAYILVSPDELRDHDRIRLTAFDADRFSADDPLGKVEISVDRLISKCLMREMDPESCAAMELRDDPLAPMVRGRRTQGRLKYSITFARLVLNGGSHNMPTRAELMRKAAQRAQQRQNDEVSAPDQQTPQVVQQPPEPAKEEETPPDLHKYETTFDSFIRRLGLPLDDRILKARHERHERVRRLTSMLSGEEATMASPPDPDWPAGILAFHVHSIQGLEVTRTQRSFKAGNLPGGAAKTQITTEDPTSEGSGSLPSSYVQVFLNDQPTLRTRTKKYDPRPFINAGTERVVYDWRAARIDFVVRDSRQRESDAILGVVGLKVADVLANGARKSAWYTLTGGLGYGKMHVTLLWRSAHLPIPRALSGWNVGMLEISHLSAQVDAHVYEGKDAHFIFDTNGGRIKTENLPAQSGGIDSLSSYTQDLASSGAAPLRMPVRQRYPGDLIITFKISARSGARHRVRAIAVVPLNALQDEVPASFNVPLYLSNDWMHVEQAKLKARTHDTDDRLLPSTSPRGNNDTQYHHVHTKALEQVCKLDTSSSAEVLAPKDGDYYTSSLQRAGHVHIGLHFFPGLADEHRSILAGDQELRYAHECWQTLVDCGERERPMTLKKWNRTRADCQGSQQQATAVDVKDKHFSATPPSSTQVHLGTPLNARQDASTRRYVEDHEGAQDREAQMAESLAASQSGAHNGEVDAVAAEHYEPSIAASASAEGEEVRGEEGAGGFDAATAAAASRDDDDSSTSSSSDEGHHDSGSEVEGRRARRRNMHRQERGAAQIKSVRTLSWLKQNLQDGMDRVGRNVGSANERYGSSQRRRLLGKMENEGVSKF